MAVVPLRPDVILEEPSKGGLQSFTSEETEGGGLRIVFDRMDEEDDDEGPDDTFDRNLAEKVDEHELNGLAGKLLREIEDDELSRKDWEETVNRTASYLGIKLEDPSASVSVDGTVCKSVATCMLEAAMKLWGIARAECLPVTGPVKVRRDTPPEPSPQEEAEGGMGATPSEVSDRIGNSSGISGAMPLSMTPSSDGDKLARALEVDMNHYLTVVDEPYYPDTSQMLMHRILIGMAFKKVYRDPLLRRPVSRWVKAQNFIIANTASHLSERTRRTERIPTSQSTMRRLMKLGHYLDIELVRPTAKPSPTELSVSETEGIAAVSSLPGDYEHVVYECYTELGSGTVDSLDGGLEKLDKDETGKKPGYPLPYRVSIDLDSRKVLEIRRNWKKGDKDHNPRRRYIKFGFIPSFGYYDIGLIHLVGNPTQSATMIQRAAVDSSLFSNFPGGVIGQTGPGQTNTVFRPNPGEFVPIRMGSFTDIRQMFMGMPYRPPSPEVIALIEKLERDVKSVSSVVEIPVGEGRLGNTPVGTIMAYIESVSQVGGSVHKDTHIAQQQEFSVLRDLFAEDPDGLVRGVRRPARKWQIAEEIMSPELVPASDPNTPSEIHRLLKVQALVTAGQQPQFQGVANQRAIWQLLVEALTGERAEEFTLPEQQAAPAPPDPRIMAAQIKAQSDQQKAGMQQQTEGLKHQERMTELASEDQQRQSDRESAETRAAMSLEAARIKAQHDLAGTVHETAHKAASDAADRQQADVHKAADIQHATVQQQADHQHEQQQQLTAPAGAAEGQTGNV